MLAVPETIKDGKGITTEIIWHKPVGPDPQALEQAIACTDEESIYFRSAKKDVPLQLAKEGER